MTNPLQHFGAFIIEFRIGSDFEAGCVEGRVEHIASGRTGCFASAEELMRVLTRVLNDAVRTSEGQSSE